MTKTKTGIILIVLALLLVGVGWWKFGWPTGEPDTEVATSVGADSTAGPAQPAEPTNTAGDDTTDVAALQPSDTHDQAGQPEASTGETTAPAASDANAGTDSDPEQTDAAAQPDGTTPGKQADGAPQDEPDQPAASDEPQFDIVRVEADGQMVVAGKAKPNETVEVLLDGVVIGQAQTDESGAFVTVLFADLTDAAQQLQLRTTMPELPGQQTAPAVPAASDSQLAAVGPGNAPDTSPNGSAQLQSTEDQPSALPDTPRSQIPPPVLGGTVGTDAALAVAPRVEDPGDGAAASEGTEAGNAAEPSEGSLQIGDQAPTAQTDIAGLSPQVQTGTDAPVGAIAAAENPEIGPVTGGVDTALGQDVAAVPAAPDATGAVAGATGAQFSLSAPVIILPSSTPDQAPALVQPRTEELAVLQPAGGDVRGIVLDRINYGETGDVLLDGRGVPGKTVRIYGNAQPLGTVTISETGAWTWSLARNRALEIRLFRFDQLGSAGEVTSRIETPFEYSALSPQIVKEREIVVQKGDALWLIAEQYYGEGVRFSVIYGANAELIRDPDLIYPGQVFSVPELVDAN